MDIVRPKNLDFMASCWQLWLDGKADLLSVLNVPPSPEDKDQRDRLVSCLNNSSHRGFYGASEAEARSIIDKGWPEGAQMVEALAKQVSEQLAPPASRRRTRKWDVDGDEVSGERLQLGYDEVWQSSHRKLRSSCGLVEVVASWGEGCSASLNQLKWSGAAALALTDLLEKADYSVELALVAAMISRDGYALVRVDLKRMGELIDLEQLAAIAVYPPAWRIFGLAAFNLAPMPSGDDYNSHPHGRSFDCTPNGMWDYRPNVMTVKLHGARDEMQAVAAVTEAIKELESLVNPQEEI